MGNPLIPTNSAPYAKKVQHTESAKNILSSTDSGGRILRFMTRARTASLGVAKLTAIQPLLGAVLMLCVSLVQGAATTLGMIFKRRSRDWHTETAHEDLPQATSGIRRQEPNSPTESFSGSSRESLLDHRGDSQTIPSTHATRMLGSSPSMTPLMLQPRAPALLPRTGEALRAQSQQHRGWGTALTTRTVRTGRHTAPT